MEMARNDITQSEIVHLPDVFNLTDGHANRSLDAGEHSIIENMAAIFLTADREQQQQLEAAYLQAFYTLTKQTINEQKTKYLFLPAASFSLEIVANHLRLKGYRLALVEPCFDNLANIFKRHKVALEPIPDRYLSSSDFAGFLETIQSDAICIVSPGNPSGECYNRHNLEQLITFCKKKNKLLILDTSFRAYRPSEEVFDEFALLQQSDIDYIVIEDTGKTWPTKELKVSIVAMSPKLFQPIYDIYTDFIYHISPVTVKLLTAFVQKSLGDNLSSVHKVVTQNQQALQRATRGTFLESVDPPCRSVGWLKINHTITATDLCDRLAAVGVFVLPGNEFFWSDRKKGDKFIRVSLVRDRAIFKAAAKKLREVLLSIR